MSLLDSFANSRAKLRKFFSGTTFPSAKRFSLVVAQLNSGRLLRTEESHESDDEEEEKIPIERRNNSMIKAWENYAREFAPKAENMTRTVFNIEPLLLSFFHCFHIASHSRTYSKALTNSTD